MSGGACEWASVGASLLHATYYVECSCGFTRGGLDSHAAAKDALREHQSVAMVRPGEAECGTGEAGDAGASSPVTSSPVARASSVPSGDEVEK